VRNELTILKKTSPSGGSQHPVEVYPLVRAVEGVQPGLCHYAVEEHELELLESLTGDEVTALNMEFTAGQAHFSSAQVLFLMTARFGRNFWKYAAHAKAYRVLYPDAAHLSQTLYLVCAELGLGAFVSAAITRTTSTGASASSPSPREQSSLQAAVGRRPLTANRSTDGTLRVALTRERYEAQGGSHGQNSESASCSARSVGSLGIRKRPAPQSDSVCLKAPRLARMPS